ncbi:MAG TPA: hypothetical protein VNF07_08360 [Acidimicrobiales bacterium]|nr:hypothetical protein [Acidimicrobiales bacterium]
MTGLAFTRPRRRGRAVLVAAAVAALAGWGAATLDSTPPGPSAPQPGPSRWSLSLEGESEGALACSSARFCVALSYAVGGVREGALYDGTRWVTEPVRHLLGTVASVACPGDGHCLAVDSFGAVSTLAGGRWSAPVEVDLPTVQYPEGASTLSCSSETFCVLVDGLGRAAVYDGGRWSAPTTVDAAFGLTALSCVAGDRCTAVDGVGRVLSYSGGEWSAPRPVDRDALAGISCAAAGSCVATDLLGRVLSSAEGRWSAPTPVDPAASPLAISCPRVGYCITLDWRGRAYVLAGGRWRAESIDPLPTPLAPRSAAIACAPGEVGFCAAAIGFGQLGVGTNPFSFTGPVVHAPSLE